MKIKEYVKIIVLLVIPIILGALIGCYPLSCIKSGACQIIYGVIFIIIYGFVMIKYLEFMSNKF